MRIETYALGFTAALGVTAALFVGCGGTTVTNQGGTTTGSGGHSTTTGPNTSTTSNPSTTTTAVTTTTTATGTTPCDMACAHIQMCTGFTCQQANINCATTGSNLDCEFNCAANTPCAQLGVGTLTTCQNQCKGDAGTGDGGTADAGPMLSACSQCEVTNCIQAGLACGQDTTCQGWLMCANTCNAATPQVPSCYAACDAMYAGSSAKFAPVYACACSKCATECSGGDPCAYGTDGGP